jgi:hypothetical protein
MFENMAGENGIEGGGGEGYGVHVAFEDVHASFAAFLLF